MAYTDIDKSDDYFNTVLYTGNGSSRSITGVNFQPDWVWIKGRSTAYSHILHDNVRGATKELKTNSTDAEGTDANGLTSFDSGGFSLGTGGAVNNNGTTFVSWNWLGANGTASNTDGSITSTVSANPTSGFSIVTTTGTGSAATIGHGLGAAPAMIIGKDRDRNSTEWRVYNKKLASASHILFLNNTNAEQGGNSATWNNTAPTSSVFSVGTSGDVNNSGSKFVFYCFAEKKGFSKFGKYTGNGNSNGAFVYTGFKPAFIIVKAISTGGENWLMWDNKRPEYNEATNYLVANSSNSENTDGGIDILSNGFKCRKTGGSLNGNGTTYIYMAFAENPFVTSTGIPGLAR